jgi:hypothetical protein
VKFVSKKFIERARYRALFDPPAEVKKAIKFQQREKVKSARLKLQDPIDAGTDLPEGRTYLVNVKTPWYKRKKTD